MSNGEDEITCKVVLLGESAVGKTSIIQNYVNNIFEATVYPTGTANFFSKVAYFEKEKKKIRFEIWDTAGQEQYHSIAKMYFLDASICILVYDITQRKSFEELKKFWIDEIRDVCESNTSKIKFIIIFIYNSPGGCWK